MDATYLISRSPPFLSRLHGIIRTKWQSRYSRTSVCFHHLWLNIARNKDIY